MTTKHSQPLDLAPKYRADAKGQIAEVKAECVATMRNVIKNSDTFILTAEDCDCYDEYAQYLTAPELAACFKRAMKS